jgi:iron complex outermembrane recepter protein
VKIFGNFQSTGVAHQIDKRLAMPRLLTSILIAGLVLGLSSWGRAESTTAVDPGVSAANAATALPDAATAEPDAAGTTSAAQAPVAVNPAPAAGAPASNYELNAVVITGTKSKLKILDSPAAISVVTKQDLEKKDIGFFDDALTGLPGVEVDRSGGEGSQGVTVSLRGIPGYEKNLALLDGFELNQLGNERVFWNRIPSQLVDHVEVVRGPFSALWGKNAVGGVINVITKEPEGKSFNFSEDWNSANVRTTNISFEDKPSDVFAYYFGFQNTGIDGYTDHQFVQATAKTGLIPTETVTGFTQTTTNTGSTVYNIGEIARTVQENNNYTGKLYFTPAQDQTFTLLLNYSYWDQPNTNPTGQIGTSYLKDATTGAPATVLNGPVSLAGTGQNISLSQSNLLTAPGKNGFFGSYLQYKGKANDNLGLTGSLAWTAGPLHIAESALPAATTPFSGTGTGTDMEADREYFANFQAEQKLDNHDVILGVNWDQADFSSYNVTFANWTDINDFVENTGQGNGDNETTDSVFAQDQWKIFPSLTAFLGARWDHWVSADGKIYNTLLSQEVTYPTVSFDQVTPKASLVYKIDTHGSLRASVGQAFNPPISGDLFLFSSGNNTESIPNPNLKPEVDTAWEIGGEYELPTQTTVSATYFNNSLDNLIYQDTTTSGVTAISQYYNAGHAQINGIEGEVKQKLTSEFDVFGNYTHLDDKITANVAQPASVGHQVPNIPAEEVNFGVDLTPQDWLVSLSGTYQSKRYTTSNNADTVNGVQGSFDPFTTFNFKAEYKFNGGNISAGVDNIFNLKYYSVYENVGTTFNLGAGFYIL